MGVKIDAHLLRYVTVLWTLKAVCEVHDDSFEVHHGLMTTTHSFGSTMAALLLFAAIAAHLTAGALMQASSSARLLRYVTVLWTLKAACEEHDDSFEVQLGLVTTTPSCTGYLMILDDSHLDEVSGAFAERNLCTTDDFTKSRAAIGYCLDPDEEEMASAFPTMLFDRNITDARAMRCSILSLTGALMQASASHGKQKDALEGAPRTAACSNPQIFEETYEIQYAKDVEVTASTPSWTTLPMFAAACLEVVSFSRKATGKDTKETATFLEALSFSR